MIRKQVRLTFGPWQALAWNQVVLRLNEGTDVGHAWSREVGPPLVPSTWEILANLTLVTYPHEYEQSWWRAYLPHAIVIDTGAPPSPSWSRPLVLWGSNSSTGAAVLEWSEGSYRCDPSPSCMEFSDTWAERGASVFFGRCGHAGCPAWPTTSPEMRGGFDPIEGLPGYGLPAAIPGQDPTPIWYRERQHACTSASAPYGWVSNLAYAAYDGSLLWDITRVFERTGLWAAHVKDLSGCSNCFQAPQSHPAPPPLVQRLRFRRTYSTWERAEYDRYNIVPPEYEITLQ